MKSDIEIYQSLEEIQNILGEISESLTGNKEYSLACGAVWNLRNLISQKIDFDSWEN